MDKKLLSRLVVITLCVGLAIGFVMGGTIRIPFVNANDSSSEVATVDPVKALEGKKIYMSNGYTGFAVTDDEAADIVKATEEAGHYSAFMMLYNDGVDVVDPTTGITFRVLEGFEKPTICETACVFDLSGQSGEEVISKVGGGFNEASYHLVGEVNTSFGTFSFLN